MIADSTCIVCKATGIVSIAHLVVVLCMTAGLGAVPIVLTSIALPQLSHEVAIEHRLSHLTGLLSLRKLVVLTHRLVEAAYSGLVEDLFLVQLVYIRQHFVDAGVIGRLQHNASLSSIHLIYTERSVALCLISSLLPHSISHKESLIRLLGSQPMKKC